MIKKFCITMLKYVVLVIAMAVIGLLLLCLVYLIPTERITANASKANTESWEPGEYLIDNMRCTYLNNYTDAFMLNTAACPGEGSILNKAVAAYSYSYGENSFESFKKFFGNEPGYSLEHYARYWNGYLIFLKPLLLFFDYSGIRIFNIIVTSLLLIFLLIRMVKSSTSIYVVAFVVSVLTMIPISMSFCMHYCVVYYILLISLIVLFDFLKKRPEKIEYLLLVVGATTTFFELSTFPLITLTFPLIIIELFFAEEKVWPRMKRIIGNAWAWVCGYIGMWGLKWIIASLIMHKNIIGDAAGQILFRTSESNLSGEQIGRFGALKINFLNLVSPISLILIGVFVLILAVLLCSKKYEMKKLPPQGLIVTLIIVSIIPPVWLMLKANHSIIHNWMTYRELSASLFALLAIPIVCIQRRTK